MNKKTILAVLIAFGLGGGAVWLFSRHSDPQSEIRNPQSPLYHCPMHPAYTSDKPGDCPICGMRLVPVEAEGHEAAAPPEGKPLYNRHPMRPDVTSPEPKQDEMGMDYVPVFEEAAPSAVPGQAPVRISPERERLIGVRTEPVQKRELTFPVRASGRVAYDPDLYNAIAEYKEAARARSKSAAAGAEVRERYESLVRSSVLRLRQLGLSQDQIAKLSGSGDPTNLLFGQAGESVWIYAEIYEYETGAVKAGQTMEVASSALPGRRLKGRVVAVDSVLNPETRTLRVRGEVPNTAGVLKPEMYVDVVIHADLGRKLAVPEEAVLDTGERKLVFVKTGPGQYEPREIAVGQEAKNYFEVLSGLQEGEQVVTSANFLIDSESRLKGALNRPDEKQAH